MSSTLIITGAAWQTADMARIERGGYGGCGTAGAIRHGVSSVILLMGCPLAIMVSMSLR